ncbi:MAG: carboxypeptidase regulatory-like domain-containing protein [Candidatus Obscuribacterales bacterium]|nr:carboxypeptidase regulatory-like domain-containing protein [Candidatus Obscuribacterales bacterium]
MTSSTGETEKNKLHLSWEFLLLQILFVALLVVLLSKPVGSISGRLAMAQEGFNLHTYDIRKNKVYAIASGPRNGKEEERGVWVDPDGKFQISQLPAGEYSLHVRVPGFSTAYVYGIFVEDGKVSHVDDIKLEISTPSVNIASNSRVFTTNEAPHFWINASASTAAVVNVYKKDFLDVVNPENAKKLGVEINPELGMYKPYGQKRGWSEAFASNKPVATWKTDLQPDSQDWAHTEFKFNHKLPPGDYFATVEVSNPRGKSDWNVFWFSVSDLGLIVKQDHEKTLVRAIDLNSLRPLSDVLLTIFDRSNNKPIKEKVATDKDGFAIVALPPTTKAQDNFSLLVVGSKNNQKAYGGLSLYQSANDKHRTYFYSDRPVYRLGQTVHFKTICRDLDAGKLNNCGANQTFKVVIENPDNEKITEHTYKTSAHGTFNGSFDIPQEGKTGAYQFTIVYPDQSTDYERIEVAQYRKPEYKVEVVPLTDRATAGQKVKFRIHADYYFGAPVTNAKVKYSIYSSSDWGLYRKLLPRPSYYEYFDNWGGEDEYTTYGEEFIAEGFAKTDESGEAIVEVETKPILDNAEAIFSDAFTDKKYRVEAEVTDISRLSVLSSGAVPVTAGDFELFVEPSNYVVRAGDKMSATISAIDYKGSPVANTQVNIKLVRRPYDTVNSSYRDAQVCEERTIATDASGKANIIFDTKAKYVSDTYYIVAAANDKIHNHIVASNSFWINSENYPYAASSDQAPKEPLSIKLDKKVYKPGETAKILITAPVTGKEGAQALICIEGSKLYEYKVVPMKSTASLVEIPIKPDYAPNVYVTAAFVGKKHQFYSQNEMLKVSPQDRFLAIDISTDKSKYKPGEQAEYTIKALQADGKPAANTELSLSVVDESIYAIRPEYAPNICKFFYNPRANIVNTVCSFPEEYSGGPSKIEPRVRKDFRDTAVWLPSLITDKFGIAKTRFKMPDNLTTWRATVRAVSMATDVGVAVQKVVSSQDIIVRLALPRFFRQGDDGEISAIVHNYSGSAQELNLELGITPQFKITKGLNEHIKIETDKAARVTWPAKVLHSGEATISIKAIGQSDGDAMETKLPVLPLGVPLLQCASGITDKEEQDIVLPLAYPKDAAAGSVKVTLNLSSSSLGPILGNFSALIDYPYGCTEQTMGRLIPSTVAMRMNKKLGVPLSTADIKRFDKAYKDSMAKLNEYQHGDGGWGWWANDESSTYMTALVLEGYHLLEESGYNVDAERKKRAITWLKGAITNLQKQLQDPLLAKDQWRINENISDLAKATYALSLHGIKPEVTLTKWLNKESIKLSPEALSYFCLAFAQGQDKQSAQALYERLLYLANAGDSNGMKWLNWERTAQMYKKLGNPNFYETYRYTGVETSALALEACLAFQPDATDRIDSIKTWIISQRGKDGWGNTKTTAQVLRAFTDVELKKPSSASTDFVITAEGQSLHFNDKSVFMPEQQISLSLKPGQTEAKLHKIGKGRLYWTQSLNYYKAIQPGDTTVLKSVPQGLALKRSFFRLQAKTPDREGKISFEQVPVSGAIKAGETLLMKVTIDTPTSMPYVILQAPLPSGGEVVTNSSKEELSEETNNQADDFGRLWWTHQDIMDDHLAFFVTTMPNGKQELHAMVRMELPGKFQMSPVRLEGMYTNNLRGYSQADVIEVKE